MPAFIHQFAQEITRKRERFSASFGADARTLAEEMIRDQMACHWHPLPDGPAPPPRRAYAVDGASAMRPLQNGAAFLVCQALLIGPDTEESRVEAEIVRGGGDGLEAGRALDRLRQLCEFRVALDHLDRMAGGMLLVDGSLLSDLSHMLYLRPAPLGEYHDLREELLSTFLSLVEGCQERDVLLAGISKTAHDSLLSESLLVNPAAKDRLCDAEILYRWTNNAPGHTTPILLGTDGLRTYRAEDAGTRGGGDAESEGSSEGETRGNEDAGTRERGNLEGGDPAPPPPGEAGRGHGGSDERGTMSDEFRSSEPNTQHPTPNTSESARVARLPCVAVFYLRPTGGEDALRVDVTGDGIGCAHTLLGFDRQWGATASVAGVATRLMAMHGGPSVYNAPLYAVDKMVRLSGQTVDSAYMTLLQETTGHLLRLDRATRRFAGGR